MYTIEVTGNIKSNLTLQTSCSIIDVWAKKFAEHYRRVGSICNITDIM
jgi:hypothetical protein